MRSHGVLAQGRFWPVFSTEEESTLAEFIRDMERVYYGLTTTDVRQRAYEYVETWSISYFDDVKMAGLEWLIGFYHNQTTSGHKHCSH